MPVRYPRPDRIGAKMEVACPILTRCWHVLYPPGDMSMTGIKLCVEVSSVDGNDQP